MKIISINIFGKQSQLWCYLNIYKKTPGENLQRWDIPPLYLTTRSQICTQILKVHSTGCSIWKNIYTICAHTRNGTACIFENSVIEKALFSTTLNWNNILYLLIKKEVLFKKVDDDLKMFCTKYTQNNDEIIFLQKLNNTVLNTEHYIITL